MESGILEFCIASNYLFPYNIKFKRVSSKKSTELLAVISKSTKFGEPQKTPLNYRVFQTQKTTKLLDFFKKATNI